MKNQSVRFLFSLQLILLLYEKSNVKRNHFIKEGNDVVDLSSSRDYGILLVGSRSQPEMTARGGQKCLGGSFLCWVGFGKNQLLRDTQLQEGRESWFQETLQVSKSLTAQVPYTQCTMKQQIEPGMEKWTGSKLGKEYIKAVFCQSAYLAYMQSTSCEMLGWMNHNLKSKLPGKIPITSDMQMTSSLWQKAKRN